MIDLLNTAPAHFLAGMVVTVSSAIYGFGHLNREVSLVRSFWKSLPVMTMAGIAIYFHAPPLLFVAMSLCALGDYFLSRGDGRFIPGLFAFLAGHLVYIALFIALSAGAGFGWSMLLVILYSSVFTAYLWRTTGKYRWPVFAYVLVITAMAAVSLTLPSAYLLTVVGVFVFVFSDSVLAVRMFIVTDRRAKLRLSWAVWVSYILGQSMILVGVIAAT